MEIKKRQQANKKTKPWTNYGWIEGASLIPFALKKKSPDLILGEGAKPHKILNLVWILPRLDPFQLPKHQDRLQLRIINILMVLNPGLMDDHPDTTSNSVSNKRGLETGWKLSRSTTSRDGFMRRDQSTTSFRADGTNLFLMRHSPSTTCHLPRGLDQPGGTWI